MNQLNLSQPSSDELILSFEWMPTIPHLSFLAALSFFVAAAAAAALDADVAEAVFSDDVAVAMAVVDPAVALTH